MNKSWIKFEASCFDGCCEFCGNCQQDGDDEDD